jgi:hypothetical protein
MAPPSIDDEFRREDDDEFGREDNEIALDHDSEKSRRILPSVGFLLGMAVLGVILALVWRSPQLSSYAQWWPGAGAQPSQSARNFGSEEQIGQVVRELDTLKKNFVDLLAAQQRMMASIESLQAGQQDLQRRSSFQAAHWYSDRSVLMFRTPATHNSGAITSPKQTPTIRARTGAQDANEGRRNGAPPLPLVSPRP